MEYFPDRPLVIQSDLTIYLEVNHADYEIIRDKLQVFAELIKCPEYIHTYRMTSISLWNAAASGWNDEEIVTFISSYAKFSVPSTVVSTIKETIQRYGQLLLLEEHERLWLYSCKKEVIEKFTQYTSLAPFFCSHMRKMESTERTGWGVEIVPEYRGELKQEAIRLGYPVLDEAGYRAGDFIDLTFVEHLPNGEPLKLRDYQHDAVQAFDLQGSNLGGQGVLVLPCGAGKTIIGLACCVKYQCATLILTTNTSSVKQWKQEILDKTTLTEEQVGEYTGERKEIKPITIATYQVLTYKNNHEWIHMNLFQKKEWGLVIYDEVHLLPAPIFRATAAIQTARRLGLTATLIREDGKEKDVFSLIGPKRFEIPWKQLEQQGYIASAFCTEVRVDFDDFLKEKYFLTNPRRQIRIAQENPNKIPAIKRILEKHKGIPTLIIGQYVDQLEDIGTILQIPVISGKMKQQDRDRLYNQFKKREVPILAVSKVANFAIDLPDATVAIQVSGTFGSRQEEAQRLGRILRPKEGMNEAYFYHIVTRDSRDQEYASKRQRFLIEQGYRYQLMDGIGAEEL